MIVNDIKNNFDTCLVQSFYHLLKLAHRTARRPVCCIACFWRKKSYSAVAPVIYQSFPSTRIRIGIFIFIKFKNRKKLYGSDTEVAEVFSFFFKAPISSGNFPRHSRSLRSCKALKVSFVNYSLLEWAVQRLIAFPVKAVIINYNAFWKIRKILKLATHIAVKALFPLLVIREENRARRKSLCVRVKKIFIGIETKSLWRNIRPIHLVKIESSCPKSFYIYVPDITGSVGMRIKIHHLRRLMIVFTVKKHKTHFGCIAAINRKINTAPSKHRAKAHRLSVMNLYIRHSSSILTQEWQNF